MLSLHRVYVYEVTAYALVVLQRASASLGKTRN